MSGTMLRGVVVGAGYFSRFQCEAWLRVPQVEIVAICDLDRAKATVLSQYYNIPNVYDDYEVMLAEVRPDFVDIVTPPATHHALSVYAAQQGVHVICQKPLAPTYAECERIVTDVAATGMRFMVHENWRWQPWYREAKRLLDEGTLGDPFSLHFFMRMGDGWGEDAYLGRQPFFREYPRLLIYETGVHFIDAFRFLFGEVETVYARLRQLNPVIKGEDSGQVILGFKSGVTAVLDGNRYNESEIDNPRFTFGEMRLDGSKGHFRLRPDGRLILKLLGERAVEHSYTVPRDGFAGDSVFALQRHFVTALQQGTPFESSGEDYLKTIAVVEAVYESAQTGQVVVV